MHLPRARRLGRTFLDEVVGFPDEPHDDQVDALSQLLKYAGGLDPLHGLELNVSLVPNDNLPPWTPKGHRMGKIGW